MLQKYNGENILGDCLLLILQSQKPIPENGNQIPTTVSLKKIDLVRNSSFCDHKTKQTSDENESERQAASPPNHVFLK